jgi:hypothetical protein
MIDFVLSESGGCMLLAGALRISAFWALKSTT